MANLPVNYRKGHVCLYCRSHILRQVKRFLRRPITTVYCSILKRDVWATCRCTRFRWAKEDRPPKPEKPAGLTVEVLPREDADDEVMGRGAHLRKLSEDHGVPVKELGGGLIAIDLKALGPKLGIGCPIAPDEEAHDG